MIRRHLSVLASLALIGLLFPVIAAPVAADSGGTVPAGFRDRLVWDGLNDPTAVAFAPSGKVYVAQKDGRIQVFDSLNDPTPTQVADLSSDVDNYWDRGLLGLVADPDPGHPYIYALYTYDHILGDPAPAPRWGGGLAETCPDPPRGTADGCVVSGRLERLTVVDDAVSAHKVLITDWCQQYPSHSIGTLAFGPEGALYVSGGDGAGFNGVDYGQLGGSLAGSPTPVNPCGDPANEGGALRSQDVRTSGDPTGYNGSVLRVDPATGAAWPGNAYASSTDTNKRRIIATGLRNPFRLTVRPDGHVWIGDVGWNTWEEIDEIPDPDATPRNFGWPCYEGTAAQPGYQALGLSICTNLTSQSPNAYKYNHGASVASGDGCGISNGSSISGIAFRGTAGVYPTRYDKGLFFADYSRKCIWFAPDAGGSPNFGAIELFANLDRADVNEKDGGPVYLGVTPEGNIIYTDLNRDEVRQIVYDSSNPPTAAFTAGPTSGVAPLHVSFDANGSSDPNGDALTYAWDMDGDGQYDDATGIAPDWVFDDPGSVTVKLRVTDEDGLSDTAQRVISAGNTPPDVTIDSPSPDSPWSVGDTISFSGSATDQQEGQLPGSRFTWTVIMEHCPSSCHEHTITSIAGVSSGSFVAPNHEYPSHLRLELKVTDSDGLSKVVSEDLQPLTGTVTAVSDPPGMSLTVDGVVGAPPPAATGIVGGGIDVSAPASVAVGEARFSFDAWSDGGGRSHSVPIAPGDTALTAHYSSTGAIDAPATCSAAPAGTTSSTWRSGEFQTSNDVDWFRFTNTSTRSVEITLGDLPVDASLKLYKGCSTLLATSDRSGTHTEQIIKSLASGSYAVKVTTRGGASDQPYALRIRRLGSGVSVRSATSQVDEGSGQLTIVGEVWNEYSTTRGPITVTAKLYDTDGNLLATRRSTTLIYATSHTRAPFRITGSLPDGFARASYSASAPVSRSTARGVAAHTTSWAQQDARWRAAGSIKATKGGVRALRLVMTLYDGRGGVIDVVRGALGKTTLSKNRSTSFVAWSTVADLAIDRATVRTFGFRP